jgi:hypothetical protein
VTDEGRGNMYQLHLSDPTETKIVKSIALIKEKDTLSHTTTEMLYAFYPTACEIGSRS